MKSIAALIALFASVAQAKYGDLVGDGDYSSGDTGLIIFGLICAGGYLWYKNDQKCIQDRIAQREREERLREELKAAKSKD